MSNLIRARMRLATQNFYWGTYRKDIGGIEKPKQFTTTFIKKRILMPSIFRAGEDFSWRYFVVPLANS